jgi:hypothetical protein
MFAAGATSSRPPSDGEAGVDRHGPRRGDHPRRGHDAPALLLAAAGPSGRGGAASACALRESYGCGGGALITTLPECTRISRINSSADNSRIVDNYRWPEYPAGYAA